MLRFFKDNQAKPEINHALQVAKAIGMSELELMGLYCSYFLVAYEDDAYEILVPKNASSRQRKAFKNELDRRFNAHARKHPKFDKDLVVSDEEALEVLR